MTRQTIALYIKNSFEVQNIIINLLIVSTVWKLFKNINFLDTSIDFLKA